jgi:hypothetical protein
MISGLPERPLSASETLRLSQERDDLLVIPATPDSLVGDDGAESATSITDGSAAGSEEAPTGERGSSDSVDELGDFDAGDVDPDT